MAEKGFDITLAVVVKPIFIRGDLNQPGVQPTQYGGINVIHTRT